MSGELKAETICVSSNTIEFFKGTNGKLYISPTGDYLIDTDLNKRGVQSLNNLRDEYHSMSELYEYRKVYNAMLFNEWASHTSWGGRVTPKYNVHKSWRHNDGELAFGGGWFIVVAILPTGQITNHYKAEDWDLFQIPEADKAKYEWDGHTPAEALERMKQFLKL